MTKMTTITTTPDTLSTSMLTLTPRYQGELPQGLQQLAQQHPTLARIFAGRHIEHMDDLDTSLAALLPAGDLLGIDAAVARLDAALDAGQHILIVGDFDCDGATSTALMVRVLSAMGANTGTKVDFIVPDRFKYGYGLTPEIVDLGMQTHQPDLIVTVDNGISSHEGVTKAHELGIEVIITDHHLTTKATPPAEAVVNPNQLGCEFASKSLVGVGVAFYVLGRLAKQRRQAGKSSYQVTNHLDLVALGTVADVGVLDKNNRILVHHGLQAIRESRCCVGIIAILEQAARDHHQINTQDFGFVIAPRINAAGRMDSMRIGIECLLTDDWGTAQRLAHQLDQLNQQRRSVESTIREQADAILTNLAQNDNDDSNEKNDNSHNNDNHKKNDNNASSKSPASSKSLVLYQGDWHQGVVGIVAGRLKESHYRPAIVFAPADASKTTDDDSIKGSARSIAGIHIRDAIEQVAQQHPQLIRHFGGHAMAAGLTLKRANFAAFAKAFDAVMQQMDDAIFNEEKLTDGQLTGQDFSLQFADNLRQAHTWGHGFVAPLFDGVFSVLNFRVLKDKHLKLSLNHPEVQYPIDGICFNYDADNWDYRASQVHLLFELDINEWNGAQNIQLMIKDLAVVAIA